MKKIRIGFGICFAVLIAALIWWLIRPSQVAEQPLSIPRQPSAATNAIIPQKRQENLETRRQVVAAIESALNAPITFYGKVVDQNGSPVPFARAAYGLLDKFNESGSNGHVDADANGFFTIQGVRGAAIGVNVSKSGYYQIHKVSDQYFSYGSGGDSMSKPPPPRDNPAVFVLQKMGEKVPLVYAGTRYYKVSKDGQPLEVKLETGGQVPVGQGNIRFERWANDSEKNQRGHFDWRLRITVTGGGLIEREGEFQFEAPSNGYQESIEINMPTSLGDKWSYAAKQSFFVKTSDDHYARLHVTIQAGHNTTPLVVDTFLNPTPGDRNLEFDPVKVVESP